MPHPAHTLTLVTYNIHHAAGLDRRVNVARIASVIKDTDPDVACLQEVDCRVMRSRRSHQPHELANALGMKALYGATLKWPLGAWYGNLILTRLPLLNTRLHMLPGGDEQRGLVEAHIQTEAGPVAVLCTHWGLSEEERLQQAEETVRIAAYAKMPVLLAGDLNEGPEGRGHARLSAAGLIPLGPEDASYPADDPHDRIDHIYGTREWRATDGYTVPSLASDHRPVVVELRLANPR